MPEEDREAALRPALKKAVERGDIAALQAIIDDADIAAARCHVVDRLHFPAIGGAKPWPDTK